eukprot:scaffold267280_cov30-Tisochrysis_lutea.AAC.11
MSRLDGMIESLDEHRANTTLCSRRAKPLVAVHSDAAGGATCSADDHVRADRSRRGGCVKGYIDGLIARGRRRRRDL